MIGTLDKSAVERVYPMILDNSVRVERKFMI